MSEGRESVKGRRDQRGQSLVLVVISMTVLLGMAALVLDLGLGWYAKRQLQASVDAAALAGAQELPSNANAVARAHEFIVKNPTRGVSDLQDTTTTKCLATAPGCSPVNALTVKATAKADTAFARIFGINSMTVGAKATACQPCGAKPLDIVIVLDRTGSMNEGGTPNKLANAKSGIMTFLSFLDAGTAKVGLAVLPPATSIANRCVTGADANYDSATSKYTVVPLSTDFKVNGAINPSSNLVQTLNCQNPGGVTHYSLAIQAAQSELATNGRPGVQKVIVFLTDGAANTGPHFFSSGNIERTRPCQSGVNSAAAAKQAGTWVYTIGYSIGTDQCEQDRKSGILESPAITPDQALAAMASTPANYYVRPDAGQLNTIFTQVAADISAGSSRLVDDQWG
jgi:Flp pilus assembly protein TadG